MSRGGTGVMTPLPCTSQANRTDPTRLPTNEPTITARALPTVQRRAIAPWTMVIMLLVVSSAPAKTTNVSATAHQPFDEAW